MADPASQIPEATNMQKECRTKFLKTRNTLSFALIKSRTVDKPLRSGSLCLSN